MTRTALLIIWMRSGMIEGRFAFRLGCAGIALDLGMWR